MKRILSILLENESGALSRVIGLFSQRGYNIDSLTVAPTEDDSLSRITILTHVNQKTIEQIKKQLKKLIDVFQVIEIKKENYIEREIILINLKIINENQKLKLKKIVKTYQGKTIHINSNIYSIQVTENHNNVNKFLEKIKKSFYIIELARSGIINISKNK